jgi:hypothetical protein
VLLHVLIDLSAADIVLFEAYEAAVLPLLTHYDAELKVRLRATDGLSEVHLIAFPDEAALERYRADPARIAAQALWARSGAVATMTEVSEIPG